MRTDIAEPQRINAANPAVSILQRKLRETNRKLAEVLRQKENLSGTCQCRAEYIDQLTAQIESLQAQLAEQDEQICSLRRQLEEQRRQAQETIRQLQEAGRGLARPAAGLDASAAGAQEAINQFRKKFAFGAGHKSAAGVEYRPESANGRTNEPADGKSKSLQYRLQILGGQGLGWA